MPGVGAEDAFGGTFVERDIFSLDENGAALGHGVTGIHTKIEQNLVKLGRIDDAKKSFQTALNLPTTTSLQIHQYGRQMLAAKRNAFSFPGPAFWASKRLRSQIRNIVFGLPFLLCRIHRKQLQKVERRGHALFHQLNTAGQRYIACLNFLIVATPEYLAPDQACLWYGAAPENPRVITVEGLCALASDMEQFKKTASNVGL